MRSLHPIVEKEQGACGEIEGKELWKRTLGTEKRAAKIKRGRRALRG